MSTKVVEPTQIYATDAGDGITLKYETAIDCPSEYF